MADVDQAKLRNLKIKTGVVKRYAKEKISYETEASVQRAKIVKFKEEGKDELFLRQQTENLKESEMMVPDIHRRLVLAYDELKALTTDDSGSLQQTAEYKAALEIMKEADKVIEASN